MSDATTDVPAASAKRGPNVRYYKDKATGGSHILCRKSGEEDVTYDIHDIPEDKWFECGIEGVIRILQLGAAFEDICNGKAFPDRALPVPKEKVARGRGRPAGVLVRAIATVRAKEIAKGKRDAGEKVSQKEYEAIYTETTLPWAQGLSKELRVKASKHRGVIVELAAMTGSGGSLDEILADPQAALDVAAE